jgi:hypothetical protein
MGGVARISNPCPSERQIIRGMMIVFLEDTFALRPPPVPWNSHRDPSSHARGEAMIRCACSEVE